MNNNGQLNSRQEKFCLNYFGGMSAYQAAIAAGYSKNTAIAKSAKWLEKVRISQRLQELYEKAESEKVMSVRERLEKLSVIGRANLTDFQTAGADGSWIDIGPENPSAGALQEITSRTEYDENGSHPTVITRVKLHNPIQAMQEMNRMQKIYTENGITVENKVLIINTPTEKGKQNIERVINGDRT